MMQMATVSVGICSKNRTSPQRRSLVTMNRTPGDVGLGSRAVLWFERQVVATLVSSLDDGRRKAVESYVDGALAALPDHIRAGVAAESLLIGAWSRLTGRGAAAGRPHPVRIQSLEASPIGPVRQYVRLLRSLVLFAEHELTP